MKIVLLVLACLVLTACGTPAQPAPKQAVGVASVRDAEGKSVPDWRALEQALKQDPGSVIPAEFLDLVGGAADFKSSVPSDAYFKVHDRTWQPDGAGGSVRIDLVSPGKPVDESVALLLEDVTHRWYVVQTLPVTSTKDVQKQKKLQKD